MKTLSVSLLALLVSTVTYAAEMPVNDPQLPAPSIADFGNGNTVEVYNLKGDQSSGGTITVTKKDNVVQRAFSYLSVNGEYAHGLWQLMTNVKEQPAKHNSKLNYTSAGRNGEHYGCQRTVWDKDGSVTYWCYMTIGDVRSGSFNAPAKAQSK